jgi:hypothetical protein
MNIFVFFSSLRHFPIFSPIFTIFSFSDPRRYFAAADVGNTGTSLYEMVRIYATNDSVYTSISKKFTTL